MMRKLIGALALAACAAAHAAGDLAEGLRAYDAGNYAQAAAVLAPLAAQGDAVAQHRLSVMHFYGRGVAEDEAIALEWARKSARQGNTDGMFFAGTIYMFGEVVPKEAEDPDREAAVWLFQAASRGHADAEYGLGLLFLAGKGVVQDNAEAMKWIRRAADHGHTGARSFFSSHAPETR